MNWYKIAQLIEGKKPWQMTQSDFLNYHHTGNITETSYNQYKTIEGLKWIEKKDYTVLYDTKKFNGINVEFRKHGRKNQYTQKDPNDPEGWDFLKDEKGNLIYMTEEQMIAEGLPTEDQTIAAFIGDQAIGWAANEWGATGVWVVEEYQRMGIGSYLLKEFRKTMKEENKIGQMTGAGINMTKAYHRNIVKEALENGMPIPKEVLEDYPKLTGGMEDASFWARQVEKKPRKYYDLTPKMKNTPEVRKVIIQVYVDSIKKDPVFGGKYVPKEIKDSPEIQEAIQQTGVNNELV